MNALDKINLIDKIGRQLQSKMTYSDINAYLKAHSVDVTKPTSGANSKWIYTKELLVDVSNEILLRIANELNIPHNSVITSTNSTIEANFWLPSHFKLFISHISSFKKTTGILQTALKTYGISGFVAHVDIEPTKEWLDEIEAGLHSMDALVAILMPGFKESNWTDQEVGFAVGRGVLIIPIIKGVNPYGFISKYQGLHGDGKSIADVAENIFQILSTSAKTRTKMLTCLIETSLQSTTDEEALEKLKLIEKVKNIPLMHLERLRDAAPASTIFSDGKALAALNKLLTKHKLDSVAISDKWESFNDFLADDIPF